jgi:V/A-type H+-transporting ATPase subunit A
MMKVIGEEGTSDEEFIAYLKGEFLDNVYLQQNAFDPNDEACPAERQEHVYRFIIEIIDQPFGFEDKDSARRFFQEMTQMFKNWNSSEFRSEEYQSIEGDIRDKLKNAPQPASV